jgi:hypothetical protein
MKRINKKILVLSIILLGMIIGVKLYKNYTYYENDKTLNIIKNKISYYDDNDALIAYKVDGKKASSFPEKGNYNVTVDCKDTATGTWDNDKWGLYISNATSEAVKCNISFEKNPTLADYITKLAKTDTTNLTYDGTSDNNLRYIGADPDNYLCFDEDCSTSKWRVIGVMNNIETEDNGTQSLVKIIKSDSLGEYPWNDYDEENDWNNVSLKDELNSGSIYETYIEDYNDLFESVTWGLGGYSNSDNGNALAIDYYIYERRGIVYDSYSSTWTGKIALMYPSDYGYATSGGNTTSRDSCLNINLWYWDSYSDCYENDYLLDSSLEDLISIAQWTLSRPTFDRDTYTLVFSDGNVGNLNFGDGIEIAEDETITTSPVGYLISTASISSGEGTNDDPWIIIDGNE